MVAAAVIGGVATLGSGVLGASAASKASKVQAQAATDATAAQERMFQQQQVLQEPFRQGGITAQNRLMELLGLGPRPMQNEMAARGLDAYGLTPVNIPGIMGRQYGDTAYMMGAGGDYMPDFLPTGQQTQLYRDPQGNIITDVNAYMAEHPLPESQAAAPAQSDFGKYARDFSMADYQADPGYAFRQSEGMKALERSAAARGNLLSGSALKGIQRFGQDLASQEYQNAFNRYQINRANQLNPLQSLMGSGQSATNLLTGAAGQMGQNEAAGITNAGAARASGYVGVANALGGALSGIGQMALQAPVTNAMIKYYGGTPGGSPSVISPSLSYMTPSLSSTIASKYPSVSFGGGN